MIINILILIIILWICIYSFSFGVWTWRKRNWFGGLMVILLSMIAFILPGYMLLFM